MWAGSGVFLLQVVPLSSVNAENVVKTRETYLDARILHPQIDNVVV